MKELKGKYGKEYKKGDHLSLIEHHNSWKIWEILNTVKLFSEENIKEIEHLMLQYPIMEMIQEEAKKTGTRQWTWVQRNYFSF